MLERLKEIFKIERDQNEIHIGKNIILYKNNMVYFEVTFDECGYSSGNRRICLGFAKRCAIIKLPWISKKLPDGDCDPPTWGVQFHDDIFRICYGGYGDGNGGSRSKSWFVPFISLNIYRHDIEIKDDDGTIKMVPEKSLESIDENGYKVYSWDNPKIHKQTANFVDKYDNTTVKATYYVEEREWRRKWLTWTKLGNVVSKVIDVSFSDEVGARKGSYKGGTMGCSYEMKPGETALECLMRMENEREFK